MIKQLRTLIFCLCLIIFLNTPAYSWNVMPENAGIQATNSELGANDASTSPGKIFPDAVVQDYIESLGKDLVKGAHTYKSIHFFVLQQDDINAYAGPENFIGVYTGLITSLNDQNEIAAVLAHEIAHVIQNHLQQMKTRATELNISALIAGLAAIAIGMKNPNAGTGAMAATLAGISQNMLNYTRGMETEADRVGLKILYQSDFNPAGMKELFTRFQKLEQYYPVFPEYLRTHPLSQSRISNVDNLINQFPKKRFRVDSDFPLIQARTKIFLARDPSGLKDYYRKQNNNLVNRYGYALALLRLNEKNNALTVINDLILQFPKNKILELTKTDIYLSMNRFDDAILLLNESLKSHPHYFPIINTYAHTLIIAGRNQEAINFLTTQTLRNSKKPALYYYLAQAYGAQGNYVKAHESQAKFLALINNIRGAIQQLNLALRSVPKDSPEAKYIRHQLFILEQEKK